MSLQKRIDAKQHEMYVLGSCLTVMVDDINELEALGTRLRPGSAFEADKKTMAVRRKLLRQKQTQLLTVLVKVNVAQRKMEALIARQKKRAELWKALKGIFL